MKEKLELKDLIGVVTTIKYLNSIMDYINADVYAIYKNIAEYEFEDENGIDNKIIIHYEPYEDICIFNNCIRITDVKIIAFDFPKK